MKTGLVLEGGAMRGMFTAGVLDVLMEHNIQLDGAVGVSAGAVFGCNYKSHQIGRTISRNNGMSIWWLIKLSTLSTLPSRLSLIHISEPTRP